MKFIFFFVILIFIHIPSTINASEASFHTKINVGVLSFRPANENQRIWQPLANEIHTYNPQLEINITSGSLSDLDNLISHNALDFVIVHPAAFIELEYKYGITNIASLVRQSEVGGEHLTQYGGVIVTLSSRKDIKSLADIRGKTIVTTHKEATAAMLMQQEEFSKAGIDIMHECHMLYTGQPTEKVIDALRSGKADVAFLRTGYIEEMIEKGSLKKGELTVIEPRTDKGFPFIHSTQLYPEWAVASTNRPSNDTVKEFTIALYKIHSDMSKDFHEFSIPLSYQSVRELMQKFHIYPFNNAPTLKEFIKENSFYLIFFLLFLAIGSILFTVYYFISSRRIKNHLQQIESILATASDGIHVQDLDGNLILYSDSFAQMLGYTKEEMKQLRVYDWDHHFSPEDIHQQMHQLSDNVRTFETQHTKKDGSVIDVEINAKGLLLNGIHYIYASSRDITERKIAEQKILDSKRLFDQLAHHDPLTHLPNRLSLTEVLLVKTDNLEDHPFALFFIDLDGFKEINDSYGHRFGDTLLIHVAKLLEEIFIEDSYIARTGGDEFVVILNCQKDQKLIYEKMQHLVNILNHPVKIDNIDVYITASVGIAMYPHDAKTTEELLQHADAAMYNAKKMGKNTYSFYSPDFTVSSRNRTSIATNLKKALQNNELILYFQPQVDVRSNAIVGAEALIRWFSPEGIIPPSVFIPIAEETGLILDVGKWVLEQSFLHAKHWKEAYGFKGRIAVNVSAHQLIHPNFLTIIKELTQKIGCNPEWIEIEITESSILENPQRIIQLLEFLKKEGFHISIDDFGTGYSSLSYLKNLPIDKLKIDISFVRNITTEPKNQTIVKTIIALAKGLGIKTIAEGVESIEEMKFLYLSNVDSIQGYYYYKPMECEAIEHLLNTKQV